jgi:hypothetical protein
VTTVDEQEPETSGPTEHPEFIKIRFIGSPPYGTEFLESHTVFASPAEGEGSERSFADMGIEVPEDLVWSRKNRFLLKVPAAHGDLIEALLGEPHFKAVD